MKKTKTAPAEHPAERGGIFDARQLGIPKMLLLGLQHTFAMFGATVLVPIITGLDVSTTLLAAGLGTLLFHLITRGKVPAFLGSSFAFLGGFAAVAPRLADGSANLEMLPYACGGVAVAGLVYVVFSLLISAFGVKRVMFCTDYPMRTPEGEAERCEALPLTAAEKEQIYHVTAEELLD